MTEDLLQKKIFDQLKDKWHYRSVMETPKLEKIVVSVGTGSIKDKKKVELVEKRLAQITGQTPAVRGAKKSIASFKVREGDAVAYQVTLRGERMRGFLAKFLNVAIPRTRDFRGIKESVVDSLGNLTIGIREHTIFPETADEDLKDVFGMGITLVSSARNKEEALQFFHILGVPFQKDVTKNTGPKVDSVNNG